MSIREECERRPISVRRSGPGDLPEKSTSLNGRAWIHQRASQSNEILEIKRYDLVRQGIKWYYVQSNCTNQPEPESNGMQPREPSRSPSPESPESSIPEGPWFFFDGSCVFFRPGHVPIWHTSLQGYVPNENLMCQILYA